MAGNSALRRTRSGALLVALGGEVDVEMDGDLVAIVEAVTRAQPADVVVDLAQVTFLGSWGLGFLVRLKLAVRAGRTLTVVGVPDRIRRVITVVGLESLLSEHDTGPPSPD